jgi:hypothetical protein
MKNSWCSSGLASVLGCVSVILLLTLALSVGPASGAGQVTTAAVPTTIVKRDAHNPAKTPTTTTQAGGRGSGQSKKDDGITDDDLKAIGAVLLFGLLAVGALLLFLNASVRRFYETSEESIDKLGVVPESRDVNATLGTAGATADLIDGPLVIKLGQAAEFSALRGNQPIGANWTAPEAEQTSIKPASGTKVEITSGKVQQFELTADKPDADPAFTVSVKVSVVDPGSEGGAGAELPFLGAGYGSIFGTGLVLTFTSVLGIAGVLGGQAIATIIGGVVGYLFFRAAHSNGQEEGGATAQHPTKTGKGKKDKKGK